MPPMQSLVKYENPVQVNVAVDRKSPFKKGSAPLQDKPSAQTEDILNWILPPREWTSEGQVWVQHAASTPATRLDVIGLQEKLDQQLQQRQARETGICPVREELYAQCFDELIRQITINCAERGLLLLRVRDELRMSISAYQTLYESAVAFGMRKALQTEQGKADLETRVQHLETEKDELERTIAEMRQRSEATEARDAERHALDAKAHSDEVAYLKRYIDQLKAQIETYLTSGKRGPPSLVAAPVTGSTASLEARAAG